MVGSLSLLVFCIATGAPASSAGEAFSRAGWLVAGGATAAALALVLWPIHAYGPSREAVAGALHALGDCARAIARAASATGTWAETLVHRQGVRTALEQARALLAEVAESGQRGTPRAVALVSLVERAELSFGVLVALTEVLQARAELGRADPGAPERLTQLAGSIDAAALIPNGKGGAPPPPPAPVATLPPGDATRLLDRLDDHVRGLFEQRAPLQLAGVPAAPLAPPPLLALRAALDPGSLELRYALRMAIAVSVAALAARALHLPRGYWVTVTVVIVLQPHAGATLRRALTRAIGTVLGATAAALLAPLLHRPILTVLVLFALAVGAVVVRKKSYALFGVFVTPLFVLMAESATGDFSLTKTRVIATLLGGAVALLAAHFLWPSWERDRVFDYVATSLARCRDYLRAVLSSAPGPERQAARRAMGLAHANAEASFERFLAEAHDPAHVEPLMTALSQARRLGAASAALSVLKQHQGLDSLAALLDSALAELSSAALARRAPTGNADLRALLPAEPDSREPLERIIRPVELLRPALARLARPETI